MISKLPRWVRAGGAVLAFIAGMINAIGFVGFPHMGITHLTGSTTLLGIAIANGNQIAIFHYLAVICSFVLGCVISGFLIQDSTLKLGRRYGVALLGESILLFIAIPLLEKSNSLGVYLASCACGLQNGMASTYSGSVIRSSHLSGMFTDLGIFVGHLLRGVPVDGRRLKICLIIIGSFLLGAMVGTIGFGYMGYQILYFPAYLTGCVGLGYGLYQHFYLQR